MRKRLLTKKYLSDVKEYAIKLIKDDDAYICIKEIINTETPFSISTGLCLINNGYKVVEILPLKENFCVRTFLNEKNQVLQKYIDISLGNNIDKETNIPYYDDIFLDIIITNGDAYVDDEDELENAFKNNEITEEDYNKAKTICNQLLSSINTNKYLIKDVRDYLWMNFQAKRI